MDILAKGIIGGIMTGLIAWLAKRGNVLPGILPLFPALGLMALYLVGMRNDVAGFQEACLSALKTIPAYLAFLLIGYLTIPRVDFRVSLALGTAAWLIVTLATFLDPRLS